MKSIKFNISPPLGNWAYVTIGSREFMVDEFVAKLNEVGIAAKAPSVPPFRARSPSPEDIQAVFEKVSKHNLNFVLVILPTRDTEIYNCVKQNCDVRYGIRHACVIAEKFAKAGNHQYNANEALKINLKLGGTNQLVSRLGIIDKGKTMLVGIDVTHPSPGSARNAPSIAAIVASIDKNLGQFPADIRMQTGKQEKVDALDRLLDSRLDMWKKHNKTYPENIIVYRDGVSEGQYNMVIDDELPQLKEACRKKYPAPDTKKGLPHISIVVVGKRHHTRFYATTEQDADERSKNPPTGTVVDRGVTEARNFDFFLQSHKALQGTARPAHYFTVYDEIFHKEKPQPPFQNAADVLHDLTHRLCYTFGRATKAVSICPPAYYADLVCERARCYLSDVFDQSTSVVSEAGSAQAAQVDGGRVTLHRNIKDTMFYI
jgi:hypothetical protein